MPLENILKHTNGGYFRAPQFTIDVSKKEIEEGIARASNHCMVAEAIKRRAPNLSHVSVDIQTIRASDKERGLRYVWLTPAAVQQHIVAFDMGKKPKPFKFMVYNGQVLPQSEVTHHTKTPETLEKRRAYARKYYKKTQAKKNAKATKIVRDQSKSKVPRIVGGKEPPRSIGARRQFGLRAFSL